MNDSYAKRFAIGLSIIMMLTVVGLLLGVRWADANRLSQSDDLGELESSNQELQEKINNALDLRQKLENKYADTAKAADTVLPSTKSQENVIALLIEISQSAGVEFQGYNFGGSVESAEDVELSQLVPVEGISGVYALSVDTSFESDYETLLGLLRAIEASGRYMQITNIGISPESENSNIFSTRLTIETYVKP